MTQTTCQPETRSDPAEATTIDTRLTELAEYNRAVTTLLGSRGLIKVEDRDCLARIRDRIERQVEALRLAEETGDTDEDDNG